MMNLTRAIEDHMTTDFLSVAPDTLVSRVAEIFDAHPFHHLPVLDHGRKPVGVISKHDYCQVQHHFTRFGWQNPEASNRRLFDSLLASELMTSNPVTLPTKAPLSAALEIFEANKVHCILIVDDGSCVGILTPHDIIMLVSKMSKSSVAEESR